MKRKLLLLRSLIIVALVTAAARAQDVPVYDIPKVNNIVVDGKADDWGGQGFMVHQLTDGAGKVRAAEDYDPRFRLAWDDRGLLVLLKVRDNSFVEKEGRARLYEKDSIQFLLTRKAGSEEYYQVILTPAMESLYPEIRGEIIDRRQAPYNTQRIEYTAARTAVPGGFVMEVLLPWSNMGIKPEMGAVLGSHAILKDADADVIGLSFVTQWAG